MPWFPDFVSAAELARRETRAAGKADPIAGYLAALDTGDPHVLEKAWPADIVIHDPRAGAIRGHKALKGFVSHNREFRAERHASSETVASTHDGRRAVVELLRRWRGLWPWSPNLLMIERWSSAPTAASGRLTDGAT